MPEEQAASVDGLALLAKFFAVRTRILLLLCLFFIAGTCFAVYSVDAIFVLIAVLAILCLRLFSVPNKFIALFIVVLFVGLLNALLRAPAPSSTDISHLANSGFVAMEARVIELKPTSKCSGFIMLLEAESAGCSGNIQVFLSDQDANRISGLNANAHLQLETRIQELKFSRRNLLLFRKRVFCRSQGKILNLHLLPQSDERNGFGGKLDEARQRILSFHKKALGDESGGLMTSIILGDRAVQVSKKLTADFRVAGLSHILAASGFNLSIVVAFIYFLARFLFPGFSPVVAFVGMCVFVLLAGPSQSIIRAFIMGVLLLLLKAQHRSAYMPTVLSLTCVISFLVDPWSASDVGLQLSYLSTAGMIVSVSAAQNLVDGCLRHSWSWLNAALAAALVAQLYVLPLQLFYFKQFNSYCVLSNVVVVPAVPFITIVGFASSMLMTLEKFFALPQICSLLIDELAYYPLFFVRAFVEFIVGLPGAQVQTCPIHIGLLLLYYLVLSILPLAQILQKPRLWLLLFSMVLVAIVVNASSPILSIHDLNWRDMALKTRIGRKKSDPRSINSRVSNNRRCE